VIEIDGIDAFADTPVLDLKPWRQRWRYSPPNQRTRSGRPWVRMGWGCWS